MIESICKNILPDGKVFRNLINAIGWYPWGEKYLSSSNKMEGKFPHKTGPNILQDRQE